MLTSRLQTKLPKGKEDRVLVTAMIDLSNYCTLRNVTESVHLRGWLILQQQLSLCT